MGSAQRDRLLQGVRVARWGAGLGAAGLTAAFSVAAAHAFKGHDGHKTAKAISPVRRSHVSVPGPEAVPPISGDDSLAAPEAAPQAVAPQQDQQQAPQEQAPQQQQAPSPPVSGGS